MHRDEACASTQQCLGVVQGLLLRLENAHLCSDGDVKLLVALPNHPCDQVPIFLQEGSVFTPLGDTLRAAQVKIHRIAERRDMFRSCEEVVRVIGAELHRKRSVERWVPVEISVGVW